MFVGGAREQPTSCRFNLVWVVVDGADPVGVCEVRRIHDGIGEEQEVLPLCGDLNGALARGVPRRCAHAHTREKLGAIFDELEEAALGEWLHLLNKERRLRRAP